MISKDGILRSFMIVALPTVASFDGRAIKEHKHNMLAKFSLCIFGWVFFFFISWFEIE